MGAESVRVSKRFSVVSKIKVSLQTFDQVNAVALSS